MPPRPSRGAGAKRKAEEGAGGGQGGTPRGPKTPVKPSVELQYEQEPARWVVSDRRGAVAAPAHLAASPSLHRALTTAPKLCPLHSLHPLTCLPRRPALRRPPSGPLVPRPVALRCAREPAALPGPGDHLCFMSLDIFDEGQVRVLYGTGAVLYAVRCRAALVLGEGGTTHVQALLRCTALPPCLRPARLPTAVRSLHRRHLLITHRCTLPSAGPLPRLGRDGSGRLGAAALARLPPLLLHRRTEAGKLLLAVQILPAICACGVYVLRCCEHLASRMPSPCVAGACLHPGPALTPERRAAATCRVLAAGGRRSRRRQRVG